MSTHDEAVAAAYAQRFEPGGNNTRQIITAYLRHMRAAGYVLARVPERKGSSLFWKHHEITRVDGFNEAIAATLANAVEVPE